MQHQPSHLYPLHPSFVHSSNSPTSSSVCRQVPGPSKWATMSLVTGSLLGKLERQWSMTGLTPFRYWYPKKWSSHQCSVTYSRGQETGVDWSGNYFPRSCSCSAFCSSLWFRFSSQQPYEVGIIPSSIQHWTLRVKEME